MEVSFTLVGVALGPDAKLLHSHQPRTIISMEAGTIPKVAKFVQHLAGHAGIQLTLDRYSHWMPSMGKHTASAMDEVLDEAGRADGSEKGEDAL